MADQWRWDELGETGGFGNPFVDIFRNPGHVHRETALCELHGELMIQWCSKLAGMPEAAAKLKDRLFTRFLSESFMTTITFVRHGNTDFNKERRALGHMDNPLNETSMKQAEAVARLREINRGQIEGGR